MKLKLTKFSIIDFINNNILRKDLRFIDYFLFLRFWLKGFDTENIRLYKLSKDNYKFYLKDSIRYKISININSNYWPILHDKLYFDYFIDTHMRTNKLLFLIYNKNLISLDSSFDKNSIISILDQKELVLKPLMGGKGKGIEFVRKFNNHYFVNKEKINSSNLFDIFLSKNNYACYEYIEQHEKLALIFPEAINTVRLTTFNLNGKILIIGILRIGNNNSIPFDNFSQGGMVSLIDHDTGVLSSAISKGLNGNPFYHSSHPDTNIKIKGEVLPFWNEIVAEMTSFLIKFPFFEYVGWDILISNDSFYVIEGNHNPDLDLVQVHYPYLLNNEIKQFFISKGIISE